MNYQQYYEELEKLSQRVTAHKEAYLALCPFQPGDAVTFEGCPYFVSEVQPTPMYDYLVALRRPNKAGSMPKVGFAGLVRPCNLEHRQHA